MTIFSLFLLCLGALRGNAFTRHALPARAEFAFQVNKRAAPLTTRILATERDLDGDSSPSRKQSLSDLSDSLLLGSSLIYTYASLRKESLATLDENGLDSLEETALILTQDRSQSPPTDHHRYLQYPITIPALQRFVELNRDFVMNLRDGDEPLWSTSIDEGLTKLAERNCELVEFDDQFSSKELVYGIVVDRTFERITVVFRGSVTKQDWKHNLQAFVKCKITPSDRLKNLGFKGEDIFAHRGFCGYLGVKKNRRPGFIEQLGDLLESDESKKALKWEEIISNVVALYETKEFSKYSLYITGHSLGGALAQLFAFGLSAWSSLDDYPAAFPITAITFASPTAGDEDTYQQAFNIMEKSGRLRHIRYSNQGDVVPVAPPQFMGYTQTGVNIHVSEKDPPASIDYRNLKSLLSQFSRDPLSHHDLNEYLARMKMNDATLETKTVEDIYKEYWKDGDF